MAISRTDLSLFADSTVRSSRDNTAGQMRHGDKEVPGQREPHVACEFPCYTQRSPSRATRTYATCPDRGLININAYSASRRQALGATRNQAHGGGWIALMADQDFRNIVLQAGEG